MTNIFCCFGKAPAVVSEVELSPGGNEFSRAMTSERSRQNQPAPDSATQPTAGHSEGGATPNIFAEATQAARETGPSHQNINVSAFSCTRIANPTVKYEHENYIPSEATSITSNKSHVQVFEMYGYLKDQSKFESDTVVSIKNTTQSLSSNQFDNIKDLIENLGQQRAELTPSGDANEFGSVRKYGVKTSLLGFRYHGAAVDLLSDYERRLLHNDAELSVSNLNELDDKEFASVKDMFLNGQQYYREYTPKFETDQGEKLELTKMVMCCGNDLIMERDVGFQFINPFQFLNDNDEDSGLKGIKDYSELQHHEDELCTIFHPGGRQMTALIDEMDKQFDDFKEAVSKGDKEQMLDSGSKLTYLFANTAPYKRGSAWASEVLASSVMQMVTGDDSVNFTGTNLDFVAFGSSASEFKHCMQDFADRPRA